MVRGASAGTAARRQTDSQPYCAPMYRLRRLDGHAHFVECCSQLQTLPLICFGLLWSAVVVLCVQVRLNGQIVTEFLTTETLMDDNGEMPQGMC